MVRSATNNTYHQHGERGVQFVPLFLAHFASVGRLLVVGRFPSLHPLFSLSRLMSCLVLSPIVLPPLPSPSVSLWHTANEGMRGKHLCLSLSFFCSFLSLHLCPVTDCRHGHGPPFFILTHFSTLLSLSHIAIKVYPCLLRRRQTLVVNYWQIASRGFHLRLCVMHHMTRDVSSG